MKWAIGKHWVFESECFETTIYGYNRVCVHTRGMQTPLTRALSDSNFWEELGRDAEDKTANDQLKSAQVSLNCYWDDDLDQEVFHCRWFHAASLHTVI